MLARPAVEAGERLGFLPGDLQAKVNPYLRPLFDALHDMIDFEQVKRFMVNDVIEVIPLAFMRGRTLNDSVIILDEAQNTTPSQMLMFLTRLGHDSKMIVTGDTTPGRPAARTSRAAWSTRWTSCAGSRASARSSWSAATSCGTGWCRTSSTRTSGIRAERARASE